MWQLTGDTNAMWLDVTLTLAQLIVWVGIGESCVHAGINELQNPGLPVPVPEAPQLNPLVFFTMFCSLRRLPAQTKLQSRLTFSNLLRRSSMLNVIGLSTMPHTVILWLSQDSFGTAPWFLTYSAYKVNVRQISQKLVEQHNCLLRCWQAQVRKAGQSKLRYH